MEALHLPDNIKVHFAGCEVQNQYIAAEMLGVRYGLFTCFPFVERKVFEKALSPIMPLRGMTNPEVEIPKQITKQMKHTIQDSGLFTLMFGARKGKKDEALEGNHQGMAIVMKGTHLCKTMRGVRSNGQMTVSHLSGIFKTNPDARQEFYKLIDSQK